MKHKIISILLSLCFVVMALSSCQNASNPPAVSGSATDGTQTSKPTESTNDETKEPNDTEDDPFGDTDFDHSLTIESMTNDFSGIILNKTKALAIEEGKGLNGSKALAWYYLATAKDYDMDINYIMDETAISNWTDTEQIWFYLDGSNFGTETFYANFSFSENDAIEGALDGTQQSWCITEGSKVNIYNLNGSGSWEEVTCVNSKNSDFDPGRIPLPAGFKGWVAIDVEELTMFIASDDDTGPLDLFMIRQFHLSVEGSSSSIGKACYMDAISIVSSNFVEGNACPVPEIIKDSQIVEVWSFENVATSQPVDLGELMKLTFDKIWSGQKEYKSFKVVTGKGVNGSKAMAITATKAGTDYDIDIRNQLDNTAVSDWTGVEQIWFWLDASEYGTEELRVSLAYQEGEADGIQAWGIKEGATAKIYDTNANTGWVDVVCVNSTQTTWNPGRIPVPAGFVGWIAYNVSDLICYVSTTSASIPVVFDAKNINQFNSSVVEVNQSAVGCTAYADCYGIVGRDVAGTECPVAPFTDGVKFMEVWGFEGIAAQ